MRRIALFVALAALSVTGMAVAQENGEWKTSARTGLALSQSSLSDNWSGSETGSVAWTWTFLGEAEKQLSRTALWSNTLNTAFGQTHQYDREVERWERPIKSTDKIRFDSVMRFTLGGLVDPYVGGYFKSQFYGEMEGQDARTLNPALISESAGIAKALLEGEGKNLVTRVGVAFRQNRNVFAAGENWTNDGGLEWVTDAKLASEEEKTIYLSKLTVFKAIVFSESDALEGTPMEDYWKSPDIDWENTFSTRLAEWLSFDFYFQLVYDKQQSKKGQYRQNMGVGLVYRFL